MADFTDEQLEADEISHDYILPILIFGWIIAFIIYN